MWVSFEREKACIAFLQHFFFFLKDEMKLNFQWLFECLQSGKKMYVFK